MPIVTVWPTPSGLPTASTTSPTRTGRSHRAAGSAGSSPSIFSTARSLGASVPTTLALKLRPSVSSTSTCRALVDDVVVGQDVAVRADDDARAHAALSAAPAAAAGRGTAAEELPNSGLSGTRWPTCAPCAPSGSSPPPGRHGRRSVRRNRLRRGRRPFGGGPRHRPAPARLVARLSAAASRSSPPSAARRCWSAASAAAAWPARALPLIVEIDVHLAPPRIVDVFNEDTERGLPADVSADYICERLAAGAGSRTSNVDPCARRRSCAVTLSAVRLDDRLARG